METNRTNWIKLLEQETESFTHTLRYFTLLGQSWFGKYILESYALSKLCSVYGFVVRLLNSTEALCKFHCIWWEFEEFTHWLGGRIDGQTRLLWSSRIYGGLFWDAIMILCSGQFFGNTRNVQLVLRKSFGCHPFIKSLSQNGSPNYICG